MPVLHVDRDPVLISIDRQRLADLGIPSEPGHECMASFYGLLGIMRPVLIVPEGWETMLPDKLPVQEEWNEAEWEGAMDDSTNELLAHRRPVPLMARIHAAAAVCVIVGGITLAFQLIGMVVYELFKSRHDIFGDVPPHEGIIPEAVFMAVGILLLSPIFGCLSLVAGKVLRHPYGIQVVAFLVLFFLYNPVLAIATLPFVRRRP